MNFHRLTIRQGLQASDIKCTVGSVSAGTISRRLARSTSAFVLVLAWLLFEQSVAHSGNTLTYEDVLTRISQDADTKLRVAESRLNSKVHIERAALAYLEKAKLTGRIEDFAITEKLIEQSFYRGEKGVGPNLTRAMFNYSVHRLSSMDHDIAAANSTLLTDSGAKVKIATLQADLFLQRGQYAKAKSIYDELEAGQSDASSSIRLALYFAYIGSYEAAERWLKVASERVSGESLQLRAWIHLQFGILDFEQGELDQARSHYQEGLALLPGYWLIEEHIAEIDALKGHDRQAEDAYRSLVRRTQSPQFMAALADVLSQRSSIEDREEANDWHRRARQRYENMLTQFPELVSGHALDYFIHQGDPAEVLELARNNYRQRPSGSSQVALVQAYSINGQLSKAAAELDHVLNTEYQRADMLATAAIIYEANGQPKLARDFKITAESMKSGVMLDHQWLIEKITRAVN